MFYQSLGMAKQDLSQSFTLMMLISIISVGGVFLTTIGLGSGIRLNADYTLHPYKHFTSWRYGLEPAMPVFAVVLTWIFRSRPDVTMMSFIHRCVTFANVAWMVTCLFFEIKVLTECNDPDGTYVWDHPQCVNRNTPSDTSPDLGWQLIFAGVITNVACSVWWMICSFTITQTYVSGVYHQGIYEQEYLRRQEMGIPFQPQGGAYYPTQQGQTLTQGKMRHRKKKNHQYVTVNSNTTTTSSADNSSLMPTANTKNSLKLDV